MDFAGSRCAGRAVEYCQCVETASRPFFPRRADYSPARTAVFAAGHYKAPPYSQGALRQIVHFATRPLKRLKAVMATRHMAPRDAMAVWSKATRDPVDDVRLLAYAMLDNSEKKLADRILAMTEALSETPVGRRNDSHKTIAALCWELVYHRLVQGAVRQHWLETARRHIEVVLMPLAPASGSGRLPLQVSRCQAAGTVEDVRQRRQPPMPRDPDSWMLYGRILLEADDIVQAGQAFAQARHAGMGEQKIAPWLPKSLSANVNSRRCDVIYRRECAPARRGAILRW